MSDTVKKTPRKYLYEIQAIHFDQAWQQEFHAMEFGCKMPENI